MKNKTAFAYKSGFGMLGKLPTRFNPARQLTEKHQRYVGTCVLFILVPFEKGELKGD
jgi:hypothetical protein